MTWSRPLSVWLAPALIVVLGMLLIVSDGFGLETVFANRLFDAYQRHLPARADSSIRVEPLDLQSWDEDTLVGVSRAMALSGVAVLAFADPMQPGPSPQSLAAKLPPGSDAAAAALTHLPEPGHDLAQALRAFKSVVPVTLGVGGRIPHVRAKFVYRGANTPFGKAPYFMFGAGAPAVLENNAAGTAANTLTPDGDGVVRRMPIAFGLQNILVPGLAAEVLRLAQNKPAITASTDERDPLSFVRGIGIASLETAGAPVPTDPDGSVRLHYAPLQDQRLDARLAADASLKDAIVIVGPAGRTVATPFGRDSVAGVMAQGVRNLLNADALWRPTWMPLAEALVLGVLGAAMIFLLRFGLGWAALMAIAGLVGLGLGSWYLYAAHGVLADAATPSFVLLAAFCAGAATTIYDLRMAYAGLRMAFSDSLPRATIEKIARRPGLLKTEGERRTVTYLVCGVRGLASVAASYKDDPAGFTRLMQQVLTPLVDQALAHGGTIDRLTADGFAAFWNAPLDDSDHALHACEAANGMAIMSARVTEKLAQESHGENLAPMVEIGVGIATGAVIAGGFGSYGRIGYSVNGDAVALAQRLQSLSHHYGPALIVSDETRRAAERNFAFLEIDTVAAQPGLAGQGDPPVTLYAIMGNPVTKAAPKFRALVVFHEHIFQSIRKQQWQMARELIAQCRRLSGASQKLYDLHLTRIAYFEKNPPGENWDGAFRPILE